MGLGSSRQVYVELREFCIISFSVPLYAGEEVIKWSYVGCGFSSCWFFDSSNVKLSLSPCVF